MPRGARRCSKETEPVRKPYCVLGSLAKALRHIGNARGAERAEADREASLLASDRFVFAAERARFYGCDAMKVHAKALDVDAANPVLLQATRTHAVTIYAGLIFDANEPRPLELTCANLELCTGAPHNDMLVSVVSIARSKPAQRPACVSLNRSCRATQAAMHLPNPRLPNPMCGRATSLFLALTRPSSRSTRRYQCPSAPRLPTSTATRRGSAQRAGASARHARGSFQWRPSLRSSARKVTAQNASSVQDELGIVSCGELLRAEWTDVGSRALARSRCAGACAGGRRGGITGVLSRPATFPLVISGTPVCVQTLCAQCACND